MNQNYLENDYKDVYQNNYEGEMMMGCPQERVCRRVFVHEVPHYIPIHTTIVNHHVYRHTFTPVYTMSECDTCENVYDGGCPGNQMTM